MVVDRERRGYAERENRRENFPSRPGAGRSHARCRNLQVGRRDLMLAEGTLLLGRNEVERMLSLRDCINAVEEVFRLHGEGKIPGSEILGVKAPNGGLHV